MHVGQLASLVLIFSAVAVPAIQQNQSGTPKSPPAPTAAVTRPPAIEPAVFARRVLATADLVLSRHIDPPTRQAMLVESVKAMSKKAGRPVPNGLARRVSELIDRDNQQQFLVQAWNEARKSADVSDEELQLAAIEGILSATSDKPHLMPLKEAKVQEQIRGNRYVGIGIQLGIDQTSEQRCPVILNPFPRGPARLAGAKPGDRILDVNGVSTKDKALEQVVDMIRGEEGSPVTLLVLSEKSTEPRTLRMQRGVIPFQSFVGFRRVSEEEWDYRPDASAPIAYLHFTAIRASTLSELRQLAPVLEAQGFQALVLDLRNAGPTGPTDVQHAVLLADELLDEGPIGQVEDYNGTKQFRSGPDCLFRRWPIVVLVNQYTRGDAEFLAAALQDNKRATIVGDQTFGAAAVQSAVEMPDGLGVVVLRTGLMKRADGRSLQREHAPADAEPVFAAHAVPPVTVRPENATKPEPIPTRPATTEPRPPKSSVPTRIVEIPVGDQKLRLRVSEQAAAKLASPQTVAKPVSSETAADGGVRPDHVVAMPLDQLRNWITWRREQDLPEPPTTGRSPQPSDPQLAKALEILQSTLKEYTRE